jgi:hypothetical protein
MPRICCNRACLSAFVRGRFMNLSC